MIKYETKKGFFIMKKCDQDNLRFGITSKHDFLKCVSSQSEY